MEEASDVDEPAAARHPRPRDRHCRLRHLSCWRGRLQSSLQLRLPLAVPTPLNNNEAGGGDDERHEISTCSLLP